MSLEKLVIQLHGVLVEYEAEDRSPQRTLEIITSLLNDFGRSHDPLPLPLKQIQLAVDAWDQGNRSDSDVLATISALAQQF